VAAPGGVSTIYLQVGNDLVSVGPPWAQPRSIWSGSNGRVLAFGASPSADLIAVLISPGKPDDRVDLVLIGPGGDQRRHLENLGQLTGAGGKNPKGAYSLAWSPDGAQVIAGLASGGILAIPRSGDPQVLVGSERAAAPGQLSWSPRGDAIAFVNPVNPKAAGGLYVASIGTLPLDPVPVVPPSSDGRRTVSRAAWTPDGASLLYTLASTVGDPTFGGDLFEIRAAGGVPSLVAGASRVGPVSTITNFAISPDGKGVAYVVTIPDDSGNPVDSLWLQPIGGGETLRLPVGRSERVTGIWWTSDGLVWSAASASGEPQLILYRAKPGEAPAVVYSGPAAPATPLASPVASPVAAADATPPGASPVAE